MCVLIEPEIVLCAMIRYSGASSHTQLYDTGVNCQECARYKEIAHLIKEFILFPNK